MYVLCISKRYYFITSGQSFHLIHRKRFLDASFLVCLLSTITYLSIYLSIWQWGGLFWYSPLSLLQCVGVIDSTLEYTTTRCPNEERTLTSRCFSNREPWGRSHAEKCHDSFTVSRSHTVPNEALTNRTYCRQSLHSVIILLSYTKARLVVGAKTILFAWQDPSSREISA